jgi:CRISPR-associated protein Cas1
MTDAAEPLIRVMALHALAYCERLFYLEEVEEIRVADGAVYAGRTLHEDLRLAEEEGGTWTSLEMSSPALGLIGKVDALRRRDGGLIPYEHKRGRARGKGKQAAAWPADALQVSAYGMLLEDDTGGQVIEGRVRYHVDQVTVRVPLDEAARQGVRQAVARARQLRRSPDRPPVTANDRLCLKCSLAPVCLPEEERLSEDGQWEPIRLFPPDPERKAVHVVEPGARVSREGDRLKVALLEGEPISVPTAEVGAVVLHGYPQITTQAIHMCTRHDIPVHWVSAGGRYLAGLAAGAGGVQRRLRQYRALTDPGTCLRLAKRLAMAKVEAGLRYVLRATRGMDRRQAKLAGPLETMRAALKAMAGADNPDSLRGHEGAAGRGYFALVPRLLRDVPAEMVPRGRNRRPPKDRFNALLGFGYALLYQNVLQAVLTVGLEPALGFYHQPRSSAHPLVLDMMELFRVPAWDMVVVGSVNRGQWDPEADFEVAPGRVWLSGPGRKKAIKLFEGRLTDQWRHPVIGYSLSYARLIELEVRLLEKEWSGRPGLFGRMRLR